MTAHTTTRRTDIGGAFPGLRRRRRSRVEQLVEAFLFLSAAVGVLTTAGIVLVLATETAGFFALVSPIDYLTGTVWSASIQPYQFGVLPLITSTLLVAVIALVLAVPVGLLAAVYLAEYASDRVRNTIKPALETIAGIPTIVLGFFAINFLTPVILQPLVPGLGGFSALAAGVVVGLLITPLVASLSDDALRAVPRALREGAYAMGATRFEVSRKVVLPAALSGVMAAVILAMSRAVGETMAVVLAAGTNPNLTLDPRESVQTMTAFIVQISLGDTPQDSIQFKALFAVGATLFAITLGLNVLSNRIVARYRNVYR
ncbi:MAG: phosphate ABC transporter permease subunit PstC [Chloroflexi bacterium]|nr:phosphate ABC transporter permease subunit PstC [Chloroflexota bacterium]